MGGVDQQSQQIIGPAIGVAQVLAYLALHQEWCDGRPKRGIRIWKQYFQSAQQRNQYTYISTQVTKNKQSTLFSNIALRQSAIK